jgi:hypothetical protein
MGVFLCLNCEPHQVKLSDAVHYKTLGSFEKIHSHLEDKGRLFVFFAESKHKIKKKAEQAACQIAIEYLF